MTIQCSCGHQADNIYQTHDVIRKGYSKSNQSCLSYETVCNQCYITGDFFNDEYEAMNWLNTQPIFDNLYD